MTGRATPSRWVFAVEAWSRGAGGARKAIRALAGALAARGRPPRVVSLAGAAEDGAEAWPGSRRLQQGIARLDPGACAPGERLAAFFPVAGADLYYPHGGAWTAWERQNRASCAGAYRLFQGIRVHVSPKQRAAASGERRLVTGSPAPDVVAISRRVADDFFRDHGVPRERLHVVHNGIDTDAFRPDAPLRGETRRRLGVADAFVCLFAAHNFRLKGLANAVACAGRLAKDRRIRWIVAGKGETAPYRAAARRLGCAGAVEFAGSVADLRPYYAASDLLVQPTFYDPCSLTTLEALACGLPVVTSAWNGAGELLGAGGEVVDDPTDADAWAEAVRRRAASGDGGRAAARAAAERCTEKDWAGRMIAVMDRVASGRGETA